MLDHCNCCGYESRLRVRCLFKGGAVDNHEVSTKKFRNIVMANHKSAEKRARQTVRRNELNRSRRSSIRSIVKEAETVAASGDAEAALKAQRKAESALAKGASRGTLHWRTAARKTSRLAKRAKAAKKA
jgi:small subunit ribosomal protein S20